MHIGGVSIWAYLDGIFVTINCLLAFSSKDRGPSCLSLWIMASFAFTFIVGKYAPLPERMAMFSVLDAILLWRFLVVSRMDRMEWIFWPLAFVQLTAIASHLIAIPQGQAFIHTHAQLNDALLYLTLIINGGASVQHDISLPRIVPIQRRRSISSVMHGSK